MIFKNMLGIPLLCKDIKYPPRETDSPAMLTRRLARERRRLERERLRCPRSLTNDLVQRSVRHVCSSARTFGVAFLEHCSLPGFHQVLSRTAPAQFPHLVEFEETTWIVQKADLNVVEINSFERSKQGTAYGVARARSRILNLVVGLRTFGFIDTQRITGRVLSTETCHKNTDSKIAPKG